MSDWVEGSDGFDPAFDDNDDDTVVVAIAELPFELIGSVDLKRPADADAASAAKRRTLSPSSSMMPPPPKPSTPKTAQDVKRSSGRRIGKGAYGQVIQLERFGAAREPAAAKFMGTTRDDAFHSEVTALRSQAHNPMVVRLIDVSDRTRPTERVIVTELLRWSRLYDRPCRGRLDSPLYFGARMPTDATTLRLAAQLVFGLNYLHNSGYAHADIKAANIAIKPGPDGVGVHQQGWSAKYIDFGSACTECPPATVGTPRMMAPERHPTSTERKVFARWDAYRAMPDGTAPSDLELMQAADVWALGLTLLEFGTAQPFETLPLFPYAGLDEHFWVNPARLYAHDWPADNFPAQVLATHRPPQSDSDRLFNATVTRMLVCNAAAGPITRNGPYIVGGPVARITAAEAREALRDHYLAEWRALRENAPESPQRKSRSNK